MVQFRRLFLRTLSRMFSNTHIWARFVEKKECVEFMLDGCRDITFGLRNGRKGRPLRKSRSCSWRIRADASYSGMCGGCCACESQGRPLDGRPPRRWHSSSRSRKAPRVPIERSDSQCPWRLPLLKEFLGEREVPALEVALGAIGELFRVGVTRGENTENLWFRFKTKLSITCFSITFE